MRRATVSFVVSLGLLGAWAASAHAATVQQWNTPAPKLVSTKDLFPRDLVDGKLVTNVVLPTGYSSRKCWPVMYLLHGTADSTAPVSLQWLQIDNGQLLKMNIPAILVIPGSGDSWWMNNWWNGYRHPAFESWVLQDLVPLVGHKLNVCSGRSEHSIAGLSMGGYGAVYLASQLPGYFGSAGSFSGVLSPESPNFVSIYPTFPTYWGPADKFYAVGHDPMALVDNLRHTRVFVGVGNGVAAAGETDDFTAQFEEMEFDQESLSFAAKARAAHVQVKFDQHGGTHDPLTWLQSLTGMLAWKPFAPVTSSPSSWTFTTVETSGQAWNYKFAFNRFAPPKQLIQFSLSHGVFSARGGGVVTITPPHGRSVTGHIPFDIRGGKLVELGHASKPHVTGGYQKLSPISLSITPPASATSSLTLSFTTTEALPRNEEYQFGAESLSQTIGSCQDTTFTRIYQPAKGRTLTVTLPPPSSSSTPGQWCPGAAYTGVTEVPKSMANVLGNYLSYKPITFP